MTSAILPREPHEQPASLPEIIASVRYFFEPWAGLFRPDLGFRSWEDRFGISDWGFWI